MDRVSEERDFRERRRSREPMEYDDQAFAASQRRSPVLARKDLPGNRSTEATESSSPPVSQRADVSSVEILPNLIHEVALEDGSSLSPAGLAGPAGPPLNSTREREGRQSRECDGNPDDRTTESKKDAPAVSCPETAAVSTTPPETFPPRPKLRRKSSSLSVKTTAPPKVNCQEKIFLCVDHSAEMFQNKFQTQSAGQTSVFKTLTSAIVQFVRTKAFLHKKHQFSLVMLNDDPQLITDLSSDYEALLTMLKDIAESPTPNQQDVDVQDGRKVFDLASLFDVVKRQSGLPKSSPKHDGKIPPPHVVRVVFVYGRSDTRLEFKSGPRNFSLLNNSPFFFVDCIYIHKPVGQNNIVETVFSDICALDIKGTSHVYEAGTDSNIACLYNIFAKLLAHPLQRPKQGENAINYNLEGE